MKRFILVLSLIAAASIVSGCQAGPEPAATVISTAMPSPTSTELSPPPTSTPTPEPTPEPTATPTPSLEETYGIPSGWQFVYAEPDPEGKMWTPELTGLRVALPVNWTCHEKPEDTIVTLYCIQDDEGDRFANELKTTLQIIDFWWDGATSLPDLVPDYEEGQAFYGYTCESEYFIIDGLEAATVACTNPAFDEQRDYENDREAYGEGRGQKPDYFVLILNGDRVDQFHFRTWSLSEMPSLFEEIVPHIHYDADM
jgi:hypothetical protein